MIFDHLCNYMFWSFIFSSLVFYFENSSDSQYSQWNLMVLLRCSVSQKRTLMNGLARVAVVQMTLLHLVESWGTATPQLPDINGALDNIHTVVEIE